ncbi:hypothetical protein E2C01_013864 [Portunus trituberculatus]|uniref:Uncharacterized protein n=1 Tax=Portunus trituberculatus TaxID=210409 RepID=A0A5B7DHQ6_PORTR|nr:hypothetical protein [Portunus trituberculatus]
MSREAVDSGFRSRSRLAREGRDGGKVKVQWKGSLRPGWSWYRNVMRLRGEAGCEGSCGIDRKDQQVHRVA